VCETEGPARAVLSLAVQVRHRKKIAECARERVKERPILIPGNNPHINSNISVVVKVSYPFNFFYIARLLLRPACGSVRGKEREGSRARAEMGLSTRGFFLSGSGCHRWVKLPDNILLRGGIINVQ